MRSPTEGRLIRLRAREPADVPVMHAWTRDAETIRFNESRYPVSLEAMRPRATFGADYQHARFAVVQRATGDLVGDVALHTMGPEDRCGFFGLLIAPARRGEGFGTDATRTLCRFAFEVMNLHRLELDVVAANSRAWHVYEKAGFRLEGRRRACYFHRGRYEDFIMMGMLRGELVEEDQ